ncbi:sulfatase [Halococcus sp. AFM35]|uniref:sulfatase n=1 Tax=Halococcus sp. AFM35 TaxID=3421653 RepID=UPI003EBBF25A
MDVKSKNVVLITVDALRQDHLGYADTQESVPTPNIDSLADESTVFTHAYANGPHTRASFPSILTGTYPWEYGGYDRIVSDRPHIADWIQQHGYRTGGFHSNPYLGPEFGYGRGFETFRSGSDESSVMENCRRLVMERFFGELKDTLAYKFIERTHSLTEYITGRTIGVPYVKGRELNQMVEEWFETTDSGPRFAWIHYMDVHDPYLPKDNTQSSDIDPRRAIQLQKRMVDSPEKLSTADGEELKRLYKGEVEYVDACLGELFDTVDEHLGLEDTVVCLISDHGEAFGEHDYYRHPHEFHEEVSRIPIMFRQPDTEADRVDVPVSNVDVFPTLLSCVGVPVPDACSGRTVLSDDFLNRDDRDVYGHTGDPNQGKAMVANREWKYVLDIASDSETLYDMENNPGERVDIAAERTDIRERLKSSLQEHLNDIKDRGTEVSSPDVSGDVNDRLERLGYK